MIRKAGNADKEDNEDARKQDDFDIAGDTFPACRGKRSEIGISADEGEASGRTDNEANGAIWHESVSPWLIVANVCK